MDGLPTVYVARRIPEAGLAMLRTSAVLRLHAGALPPTREELLSGVAGCSGILSLLSDRIDAEVMDAAGDDLRVISNFAVGFNNIDLTEAERRCIPVGNTPDVLTEATADIAVGLILAAARQFRPAMQAVRDGGWRTWEPLGWIGQDLVGKTLGIIGMGRIGQAVAGRMQAGWRMRVLYTARRQPELPPHLAAQRVALEELLAQSDVVSIHVPLSEATRHFISRPQLRLMKPTAVLVNTARGEVIDQEALADALQSERIFAAGLDVCTPEPLPLDHPLQSLTNCLLLPHIGSATTQARAAMATRAAENILAGLAGRPLPYRVAPPTIAPQR
ncbi:MAG: D-glycerate dehydrogenase [Pirellulaceae bacterium]|nr:D-glycerate dehydrogenase [Pirellulaceae bacterium]